MILHRPFPGPAAVHTGWPARLLLAAIVAALLGALAGCGSLRGTPTRFIGSDEAVAAIAFDASDVADLVAAADEATRNAVQNKAVAVIDVRWHQFVRELAADRADASAAVAGTTLGASTAGAFVESVKAKTNYALFAAGLVGAFGIVDKSYFYEKTVDALVAAMGAARAKALLRIRNGQAESITSYNGTAALRDLEEYFTAGTVLAGLAEATTTADREKQDALTEIRILDAPDDAEIARRKRLTAATFAIKDAAAMARGNQALQALGLPLADTPRAAGLALRRAMRPATPARLNQVEAALRGAGLL